MMPNPAEEQRKYAQMSRDAAWNRVIREIKDFGEKKPNVDEQNILNEIMKLIEIIERQQVEKTVERLEALAADVGFHQISNFLNWADLKKLS